MIIVINIGNICKIKNVISLYLWLIKWYLEKVYVVNVINIILNSVFVDVMISVFLY